MKSSSNELDLDKTLEMVKASRTRHESMGLYHQELVKWARNVDKRYAWVALMALWAIMGCSLGPYRLYGLIFAKVTSEGIYTRQEASWPVSMIFTVENCCGPLVSVAAYHISGRNSIFVGGLLLALGNILTYWSDSLVVDVITIGVVQGVGYSFIFMPFMDVINSYFIKYRNAALGFALCGGTMTIFIAEPIVQWMLQNYQWRAAYIGLGAMCALVMLMVPFLKPNPRPKLPACLQSAAQQPPSDSQARKDSTLRRMSYRALSYQNSLRRQSTILITRQRALGRQPSTISVNPFASSVGLERKISRAIVEDFRHQPAMNDTVVATNTAINSPQSSLSSATGAQQARSSAISRNTSHLSVSHNLPTDEKEYETKSLGEIGQDQEDDFGMATIMHILKTPGFHLIWYLELVYFWVFSIYCLVLIDYGVDRGCTYEQAESLLKYQSLGEIIGRIGLTILVDMRFLSNRNTVTLNLLIVASLLVLSTQIQGYTAFALITVMVNAFASLIYILLNGLLVDFLGERHVTIGYGMASFSVGFLIIFRPHAVGFFRDTLGSYDLLMIALAASCAIGAVFCILEGLISRYCRKGELESKSVAVSNA